MQQDYAELLSLTLSLGQMARAEISKLDDERLNDPIAIENNKKQRDLLLILANALDRITAVLSRLEGDPAKTVLLGRAKEAVDSVAKEINVWWMKNATEAIEWGVRLPVVVAGVAALGWAGANMTVATTAVAAIVGGKKVADAIKFGRKS